MAAFDPTGYTKSGGNSDTDVYTNNQTGQIVYVNRSTGQAYDSFSQQQAKGSDFSPTDALGSAASSVWNNIKPPSTQGIQDAAADAKSLEQQFMGQMQSNPYAQVPGVQYAGSAPVVGPNGQVTPTGAAAAGHQPVGGGQAPQPMGQAPSSLPMEARSGVGHFSVSGAPASNGAPDPGSGNATAYGGSGPIAAPPAATGLAGINVPAAPGMVAASMGAANMGAGAQLDPTQQAQFRQGQLGLASALQDAISGRAPSVAQLQQQQAFGQQEAQQLGLASAMGRGGNTALALRTAAGNMGNLGAQQASASALLRAQEEATARAQLGDVLNSGRGADIGMAGQNAGLSQAAAQQNAAFQQAANAQNAAQLQQANANNQQSQLQTRGQNIQNTQNQASNVLDANKNQVAAATGQFNAQTNRAQQYGGLFSSGLGAASTLFSDKRLKKNIDEAGSPEFREFLSKIQPKNFSYRGSEDPKVGVMAQDVEKSRVGSTMVRETPVGKAIDIPSATGGLMAALADMHKRVSALEGRKKAA